MTRKKNSLSYKLLVFVSLVAGIVINVAKTTSLPAMMSYFTIQSNAFCMIVYAGVLYIEFCGVKPNKGYYIIKGMATMGILLTMIVYFAGLLPLGFRMDVFQPMGFKAELSNSLVHCISPILVIFDYIIFDDKGNFEWYFPILWMSFPFMYVIYVYSYAGLGGKFYGVGGSERFAYFFLDYIKIGVTGVIAWIAILAIGMALLGSMIVIYDQRTAKMTKGRR